MEKRQLGTKPTGACEKIYKTVSENCPFRSIHRLPLRSKIAVSEHGKVSPNHPPGKPPSKTHFSLRKLIAPYRTHPGQVNIPIEPGPSVMMNENEKRANSDQQRNGSRAIFISNPTTQAGDHSTNKGNKTATPARSQATKPAPVISGSEKLKKTTVASGNAELPKVQEKPKKKTESKIPPSFDTSSNIIVVHSPGQGHAIATPKVESAPKPQMPVQGLQPKTKPATSVAKSMPNQDEPINDTRIKDGKKPENTGGHDHNYPYTAYIEHVKSHLRTKSFGGEETPTEWPPTTTLAKRDSFNDKITNFITKAKKNIKMTHHGD